MEQQSEAVIKVGEEGLAINRKECDIKEAYNRSSMLWAVTQLGEMIVDGDTCSGYEGITSPQWNAIGYAIKSMADVCHDAVVNEIGRLEIELQQLKGVGS